MGKLIVIEGLDGSGKATQTQLLSDYLKGKEIPHMKISFPDYARPSSTLVKMYLGGELGAAEEVNAYAASSFYAVDRYASYRQFWQEAYRQGTLIVADRYTTSNAVHQMSKLLRPRWAEYLQWLEDYEYQKLGLPRPDLVVYLDMSPEVSKKLIIDRYGGDEKQKDIHEADFSYLLRCREAGLYTAKELGWKVVQCSDDNTPYPPDMIGTYLQKLADALIRPKA